MVRSNYLGAIWDCVVASINKRGLPKQPHLLSISFLLLRFPPSLNLLRGPQMKALVYVIRDCEHVIKAGSAGWSFIYFLAVVMTCSDMHVRT